MPVFCSGCCKKWEQIERAGVKSLGIHLWAVLEAASFQVLCPELEHARTDGKILALHKEVIWNNVKLSQNEWATNISMIFLSLENESFSGYDQLPMSATVIQSTFPFIPIVIIKIGFSLNTLLAKPLHFVVKYAKIDFLAKMRPFRLNMIRA